MYHDESNRPHTLVLLQKSTIGFNMDRAHNMKSLKYHKSILTKERTAITSASMGDVCIDIISKTETHSLLPVSFPFFLDRPETLAITIRFHNTKHGSVANRARKSASHD